jgi:RES domain-containing protein
LATLETLVHISGDIAARSTFLVKIYIPSPVWRLREIIKADELDPTWRALPAGHTSVDFGTEWLTNRSAPLLLVPSIIVLEEYNVLVNPLHPATNQLTATVTRQYIYDPRLALSRK